MNSRIQNRENIYAKRKLAGFGFRFFDLKEDKSPKIRNWHLGIGCDAYKMKKDRLQGMCPHFACYAVLDIDYHPDFSCKDEFRCLAKKDAQKMLKHYILEELADLIPDWKQKILHWDWSVSGYGAHVWFRKTHPVIGRKHLKWGDLFNGKGYVVCHDPVKLWNGLNKPAWMITEIEDGDLHALAGYRQPVRLTNTRQKKQRTAVKGSYDAMEIIRSVVPEHRMQDRLSDKEDKDGNALYRWTPYEIGKLFSLLTKDNWDDFDFWFKAGAAINDIGTDTILYEIWTALSKVSCKFDAKHQAELWAYFKRGEISMGTICYLAGYDCQAKDFTDIERFASSCKVMNSTQFISNKEMYAEYCYCNKNPHPQKSFTARLNDHLTGMGLKRKKINGVVGWKGVMPPRLIGKAMSRNFIKEMEL